MTNGINRRYGIMTVAIIMAFISLLTGTKGSPYTVFWIYAAYLSYKGDIKTLKSYLVVLIWINVIIAAGVILFVDSKNLQWILPGFESHIIFFIAVGIPLAVKVAVLLRINSLLNIGKSEANSEPHQSITPNIPSAKNSDGIEQNEKEFNKNSASESKPNIKIQMQHLSEDEVNNLYSIAMDEAQGNEKNKGLWAKCFSQSDGNTERATAKYIEERFRQLKANLEIEKTHSETLKYVDSLKLKSIQSDSDATFELANIIYNGTHNQTRNSEEAFKIMMKAAYMGNAKAQHALSSMYWKGEGTIASKSNAHAWAVMASSQVADAKANVSFFQKQMRMEEIYESDDLVRTIKKHSNL